MPYKVIELTLTDEQMATIDSELGDNQWALIAQPQMRGRSSGLLYVYVCTPEQYKMLDVAVIAARELPMYQK